MGHGPIRSPRGDRVLTDLGLVWPADLPIRPPYVLRLPVPPDSRPSLLRPSIAPAEKYRNINLSSIGYAFRPRLRVRLTLGGRTLPRKPWISGGEDFHLPSRYSYLHGHSHAVHHAFRRSFNPACDALLPLCLAAEPAASVPHLSPDHFRRGITRPVSCYALFK